jgi:hypothetical protein
MKLGSTGSDVAAVQSDLVELAYLDSAADVDGIFGERTDRAVRAFQKNAGLDVDGIVGPNTLEALGAAVAKPSTPAAGDAELEAAGRRALEAALVLFGRDIVDPAKSDHGTNADRCRHEIEACLKAGGRADLIPYLGDGHCQWCGYFLAKCYLEAGIDPALLPTWFGSTWRLWAFATYHDFDDEHRNPRPSSGPYRLACELDGKAPTFEPRAGDILIVGNGSPKEGDHITIVESFDAATGTFVTISGNGSGTGPKGNSREGVSRKSFKLKGDAGAYIAMWLYRIAPGDLAG